MSQNQSICRSTYRDAIDVTLSTGFVVCAVAHRRSIFFGPRITPAKGSIGLSLRILLVDDHALLRRGVESLIVRNALGTVCGEAADGEEAVRKARELQPDLIIMDVSMPKFGGIDATRQIRKFNPTVKIIILTMHQSEQMAVIAKHAGANGFVEKTEAEQQLARTIREVCKEGST